MSSAVIALDNGLGYKPAMGVNPYSLSYGVNETVMMEMADIVVKEGLDKLGYIYMNIDEGWQAINRTADGKLTHYVPNFPSGMKFLADYMHNKSLKFGLYSDAGYLTCGIRPGSLFYEDLDAQTLADWGVDYLKYDNCYAGDKTCMLQYEDCMKDIPYRPDVLRYSAMALALNKTGRPIYYAMCNWGLGDVQAWGPDVGNAIRTQLDMNDQWSTLVRNFQTNTIYQEGAKPGAWNDLDLLQVGVHLTD